MKYLYYPFVLIISLVSCSKSVEPSIPITIDKAQVDLYYDQTNQFSPIQGSTKINPATYKWSSSNPYVGVIDNKGLFSAKHVGRTTVTGISNDKGITLISEINVTPYSTMYREPLIKYASTTADIILYETRTMISRASDGLMYKGENSRVNYVLYNLANNVSSSSAALFPSTSENAKEVTTFLKERYNYKESYNSIYRFSDDKTFDVGLTVDQNLGLVAIYIPRKSGGRVGASAMMSQMAKFSDQLKTTKKDL